MFQKRENYGENVFFSQKYLSMSKILLTFAVEYEKDLSNLKHERTIWATYFYLRC